MCHPAQARALLEQRSRDLAQLRRVRDRSDRDDAQPSDVATPPEVAHNGHYVNHPPAAVAAPR